MIYSFYRNVLRLCGTCLIALVVSPYSTAAAGLSTPPVETLRAGDFLWPKLPGKIVPYDSQAGEATEASRLQWENDRKAELSRLEGLSAPSPEEKQRYELLSRMTYQDFLTQYLTDYPTGTVMPYGALGLVATGHVAIVDVRDGGVWVIEAMLKDGVREITYEHWLAERPGEIVWQGRLKNATEEQRELVATVAKNELGKPYIFFNFNLADESGFYCSKLAWFSVWKATGQALDNNPRTKRVLWFSPKQMLHAELIEILFNPKPY